MFSLSQNGAHIYTPSGSHEVDLAKTEYLGVGAHQDDLEFMAYYPILRGFEKRTFAGVVVTNGAGSARTGKYANHSDDQMVMVRRREQLNAATIGRYCAMVQLNHPSADVKNVRQTDVADDLEKILRATKPREVYTHNLADKHDTHIAVILRLVDAIKRLPEGERPEKLIGCPVWRDLDWLVDKDKVIMDASGRPGLEEDLLQAFPSQIVGGKRYDLATLGRRRASATYLESHEVDKSDSVIYGMNMTPLMHGMEIDTLLLKYLENFQEEVVGRILRMR